MSYRDQVIDRNRVLYELVRERIAEREYWLDRAWWQKRCGEDASAARQQAAIYQARLTDMRDVAALKHPARTISDVWEIASEDAIGVTRRLTQERQEAAS